MESVYGSYLSLISQGPLHHIKYRSSMPKIANINQNLIDISFI